MAGERRDGREGASRKEGRISRREVLEGGALGAAAFGFGLGLGGRRARAEEPAAGASPAPDEDPGPVPLRPLGRTGEKVSVLGLGTASMGEGPQSTEECASVYAEAIDRGVRYVDTARIYGNAETALGRVLETRRDEVFLVTKCMTDTFEGARESFEASLRELGVDSVDLLHLHSTGDRDLDKALGPQGAWTYLQRMKKEGRARFTGITGHNRPAKFLRVLETGEVDVMMVAMNFVDRHTYGFEEKVLPEARRRGVGVMGMKTFGGIRGGFRYTDVRRPAQMDAAFLQNAVRYSLSLEGLTGVVIGVHDAEELRQNIRYVNHAAPLSEAERAALRRHGERLSRQWGPRFGPVS